MFHQVIHKIHEVIPGPTRLANLRMSSLARFINLSNAWAICWKYIFFSFGGGGNVYPNPRLYIKFQFHFYEQNKSVALLSSEAQRLENDPASTHRDRRCHQPITLAFTWMRLAAGFLLFSKCFWRCCSCTFNAKPEPRMPWNRIQKWYLKFFSKGLLSKTNIKKKTL